MHSIRRVIRRGTAALALTAVSACSQAGSLGNVLGGVLGGGSQQSQVSGTIQNVDPRNAQIMLRQSNGQTVALQYDNNTKVVYQNQNYAVSNLEYGDQVTARIQQTQNNGYYTDLVQVDQSVTTSGSTSSSSGQLQTLQGSVRRIDAANGLFLLDVNSSTQLTVSMPYNPTRADQQRFQNLRVGDQVRFGGVYLNNSRVELRQFY